MNHHPRLLAVCAITTITAASTIRIPPTTPPPPVTLTLIPAPTPRLIIHPNHSHAPDILEYHWTLDHDLNHNHRPDLIIGAPQHRQGRGVVLILLDPIPIPPRTVTLPLDHSTIHAALTLPPDSNLIHLGSNPRLIPDFDGDHHPDIEAFAHPPGHPDTRIPVTLSTAPLHHPVESG